LAADGLRRRARGCSIAAAARRSVRAALTAAAAAAAAQRLREGNLWLRAAPYIPYPSKKSIN